MIAAAHEFRMRKPDEKGFSARATFEGRAKRAALMHGDGSTQHEAALRDLDGPSIPVALNYLWLWFNELDRARKFGMDGPEPIGYTDIDAWARLTGRTPDAPEVDALLLLDAISRHPDAVKAE